MSKRKRQAVTKKAPARVEAGGTVTDIGGPLSFQTSGASQDPSIGKNLGGIGKNLGGAMSVQAGRAEPADRDSQNHFIGKNLGGPLSVQVGDTVKDLGPQQVVAEREPAQETQQSEAVAEEVTDPRFQKYTDAFQKNGKLTDAEVAEAAKDFGVSPAIVRHYVNTLDRGDAQMSNAQISAAHETVGGEANWKAFADWANANPKDTGVADMLSALQGNMPSITRTVVAKAYESFKAAGGTGPRDVSRGGSPPAQTAVQGFSSKAEQNAAIRDPRYHSDANYRAQVEARIVASRL